MLEQKINNNEVTNRDKKRKGKTPVESEKEPKRIKKTNSDHDSYCWKCHNIVTKIENLPEIECSTCPRSFHSYCIKSTKIDKDRSCYVCQQQSDVKTTSTIDDELHLSKLLLHIIDTACPMDSEEYRCVQKGIQQYESHVELIEDIEWIQHNCIIIYGDKSQIATSAKKILHEVQKMLKDALDCPECYYKKIGNEPLAFLNICKIPHPLVWAKVKGYSYWPAKNPIM
ncbi:MYND-type zinc finger-containing chromatin reader Zmynd8 [Parasteatoda tepidariorum]|uniref:MYND-type zinc finger-containing chromatin reader Zmynd8 n=1 Tax=Parasteatoda tepidariorum TaxID=114398 RepID=UPI0039BCAAB0